MLQTKRQVSHFRPAIDCYVMHSTACILEMTEEPSIRLEWQDNVTVSK